MTNMLLAATNSVWNYVLIGAVVLLLIGMPIMMNARNKRDSQKVQEQTNSLKIGDNVLTTSGVYGTIVELKFDDSRKEVVLETGGKNKSYISVDAYAIYTVLKSDEELAKQAREKAESENKTIANVDVKPVKKETKKKKTPMEVEVEKVTQKD